MSAKSYDQYIGDKCVLPDWKGEKLMGKVSKCIKYGNIITLEGHYDVMNDNSVYEVNYSDGTTEKLTANIIA